MNILGCLDRPTSGHYWLEGVDVASLREPELARIRSERLGFVFQSFNLLARTSADRECRAAALLRDGRTDERRGARRTGPRGATLLGLGERERNTPGQLSGGQQQRVAIARALINSPSLSLPMSRPAISIPEHRTRSWRRWFRSIATTASRSFSSPTNPTSPPMPIAS